jgi:hypothetical protein
MHIFKDNAGRSWTIAINVYAVKHVKALIGVDLYGLIDKEFQSLDRLLSDPVTLVDVIYCLCKDDADRLGISDQEFGRGIGGDSLERATDAFLEELTDFFPDPRMRAGLKKVIEKGRAVRTIVLDRAMEQLDEIDVESEARKLIDSSGRSPESSESTPARLRSVS